MKTITEICWRFEFKLDGIWRYSGTFDDKGDALDIARRYIGANIPVRVLPAIFRPDGTFTKHEHLPPQVSRAANDAIAWQRLK